MTLTDIDICSNALVRLGDTPISSFTGSDAGRSCAAVYPFVKLDILTSYPWRINSRKSDLLSRDLVGPTTEYKYSYQLPTDMIGTIRKAFNSKKTPAGPQHHFQGYEIYGRKAYTNAEQLLVDYQIDVNEQELPYYMVELLILATAAEVALANTDKQSLGEYFSIKAWGLPSEKKRGGQFKKASLMDSQGQRPPRTTNFPLTAARQGG